MSKRKNKPKEKFWIWCWGKEWVCVDISKCGEREYDGFIRAYSVDKPTYIPEKRK